MTSMDLITAQERLHELGVPREVFNTCHVCYDKVSEDKVVTCENGHTCCQTHHLERIRAIHQEKGLDILDYAYDEDCRIQCCFVCRCFIDDHRFSKEYLKCVRVIVAIEASKFRQAQGRRAMHPLDIMEGRKLMDL